MDIDVENRIWPKYQQTWSNSLRIFECLAAQVQLCRLSTLSLSLLSELIVKIFDNKNHCENTAAAADLLLCSLLGVNSQYHTRPGSGTAIFLSSVIVFTLNVSEDAFIQTLFFRNPFRRLLLSFY